MAPFMTSLFNMTVNKYHQMLGPQQMISPDDVAHLELTNEQKVEVKKALEDFRFRIAPTYRDQVYRLCSLLHKKDELVVSYEVIGKLFATPRSHGAITDEYKKSQRPDSNEPHRPYILTEEEIEKIEELIVNSGKDYLTIDDIGFYVMLNFDKCPSRSTLKRTVKERIKGYKIVKVKGIEDNRYDAEYEDIKEYYKELEEEVKGVPVGFVFNLDESGQNTYVDARNIYVIVPQEENVTTYPVNRNIKRITLLHCIATDGTSCDPLIILPRLTLDDELFDIIPTGHVMFASQEKGFMTHQLFSAWFEEKFIPYLINQQDQYHYYGKSVIIMDGFKGHEHSIQRLKNLLEQFNIKMKFIPAHTSDQVQPLDLFGFNIQKCKTAKYIFNHHYSIQTNQILAILDGLNEIKSYQCVSTAWRMAGIFRTRKPKDATPNEIFRQEHIVRMDQNFKIRNAQIEKEIIRGRQSRLRKHEVLKPNEIYLKRKELRLRIPQDFDMNMLTVEEVNQIRRKYSIRRFQHVIEQPKNHKITEYRLQLKTDEKKKRTYRKRTPKQPQRVASIRLPSADA